HALLRRIERRHHDDRQHRRDGVLADLPADVVAAHARHHDVEQDQPRPALLDPGERLGAVGGGDDVVALDRQEVGEQLHVDGHVVDHQDLLGHALAYLWACRSSVSRTTSMNSRTRIGLVWYPSKPAAMIFLRSCVMAEAVTAMTGIVRVAGSARSWPTGGMPAIRGE